MLKLIQKLIKKKKIKLIDYYFAKIIDEKKNNPLILIISIYISFLNRHGNTYVSLKNILKEEFFSNKILSKIKNIKNIKKELLKSNNISETNKNSPLIIDNNHLHLHKTWHIENKIYKFFTKSLYVEKNSSYIKIKKIFKNKIFINLNLEKKIAILLCLLKKFMFILGDPGTGKTTLIAKIIYFFISILKKKKIVLSAPTGKASSKLLESITKNLLFLKNKKYKKYVPKTSFTIHRLFKINQKKNIFFNKIKKKIDILIIDESSMIDIFMLEKIIDHTSKKTQIFFFGDHYQLPAINTGSIIKDILIFYKKENLKKKYFKIKNLIKKNIPLTDKVFFLKKKYRFKKKSDIHKCSEIIKKRKIKQIQEIINNKFKKINFSHIKNKPKSYKNILKKVFSYFKKFFKIIKKKSIKKILKYFNKKRILCVVKKGNFGIEGINKFFKDMIKKKYPENFFKVNKKNWYIGKPIIILKNLKSMNLFNGSIGITLLDKDYKKKIFFLMPDQKIKIVPINLIKYYKTTWASTIHKSQGSEFSKIYLIIPPLINKKIMTRELIYTAITRSKKYVFIYSKKSVFIQAIKQKIQRKSGLYIKFKKINKNFME
jgi:exodeoxyribonuclease V alpha subunit